MKIFITGGTGFIGQNLVKALLSQNHEVVVLSRSGKFPGFSQKTKNLKIVKGDLFTPLKYTPFLKGVDVLFHLAALRGEKTSWRKEDYLRVNTQGTEILLNSSLGRVKRFIFTSSVSTTANLPKGRGDEKCSYSPDSFYGESKVLAEEKVLNYQKKGLETIIVRPGIVYGPGDDGLITKIIFLLQKGFFVEENGGKNLLPLIYIDDLVDFFLKIMRMKVPSFPLLAVSDEKVSLDRILRIISQDLPKKPFILSLPREVLLTGGFCFQSLGTILGFDAPLTVNKVRNLSRDWWFNAQASYKAIGFKPQVKIEEGLERTVEWFLKENGKG